MMVQLPYQLMLTEDV